MDPIIEMNGKQVFTADWVFQQMQAQNRRIDRAQNIAVLALILVIVAVPVAVAVVVTALR